MTSERYIGPGIYSISGGASYANACKLVKNLEVSGIEASIVVGGIHIRPTTTDQVKRMYEIYDKATARGEITDSIEQDRTRNNLLRLAIGKKKKLKVPTSG